MPPLYPKLLLFVGLLASGVAATEPAGTAKYGPAAALAFARNYRGEVYRQDERLCYPDAVGVPFGDCENILPMTADLWRPAQLQHDFARRMAALPRAERKRGIIVLLKTERCAPTEFRACTTTTAALEKRSSPVAAEFLIYGLLLKPRDHDTPPGSLPIETGADAWKNEAAGEYFFKQGPGATLVFLDPVNGAIVVRSNALLLGLQGKEFEQAGGATPTLQDKLQEVLDQLRSRYPQAAGG